MTIVRGGYFLINVDVISGHVARNPTSSALHSVIMDVEYNDLCRKLIVSAIVASNACRAAVVTLACLIGGLVGSDVVGAVSMHHNCVAVNIMPRRTTSPFHRMQIAVALNLVVHPWLHRIHIERSVPAGKVGNMQLW